VKTLLEFFDNNGLVHHEFILAKQNVTGHFYVQVLQRLHDAVLRKQRNNWQGQWFLYHGNTLIHTLLIVQQFLVEKNIPVIT
jgi:hypothetical protein